MKGLLSIITTTLAVIVLVFGLLPSKIASALSRSQISTSFIESHDITTSSDGRYVAYITGGQNSTIGDTNQYRDAYLYDTINNTTTWLSVPASGLNIDGDTFHLKLSDNGRYALITSWATTLTTDSGGQPYEQDASVYLRDIKLGQTYLIARNVNDSMYGEAVSDDGRFVYYSELDGAGLYVRDRTLNTTTEVDKTVSGGPSNSVYDQTASASCDGRYVVFSDGSPDLVNNDTNGYSDIFLSDQMTGDIKNITLGGNGASNSPKMTCDGNYIYFTSTASNLGTVTDTNGAMDIYRYDIANNEYKIIALDSNGNQYGGYNSQAGWLDSAYSFSQDGRYAAYIVNTPASSTNQNTGSSKLVVVDNRTGLTTDVTTFGFNAFARNPAMTYDGRTIYLSWQPSTAAGYLYTATNYL